MKFLSMILRMGKGSPHALAVPSMGQTLEPVSPDDFDAQVASAALDSLDEQMHEVVDRNADGVNRVALIIRRESDLLLTLGISDPFAAKAGSLAQKALELSNAGRGLSLQAVKHDATVTDRAHAVSQAMAFVTRAEILLAEAKRNNRVNIDNALSQQAKLIGDMHRSISTSPLLS